MIGGVPFLRVFDPPQGGNVSVASRRGALSAMRFAAESFANLLRGNGPPFGARTRECEIADGLAAPAKGMVENTIRIMNGNVDKTW